MGGFLVYKSFAAAPDYGAAVMSWYSTCKYSPLPKTNNSGYLYWKNRLQGNVANQNETYKAFRAASVAFGKKNCPTSNPYPLSIPKTSNPPTNPNNPPAAQVNYLKKVDDLAIASSKLFNSSKTANDFTYKISQKSTVTRAEVTQIKTQLDLVTGYIPLLQANLRAAQGHRNSANSYSATRSQVGGIDSKIQGIGASLSGTNQNKGDIHSDWIRAKAKADLRSMDAATPMFATPSNSCKDRFYAQSGHMNLSWKDTNGTAQSGSVNAVTCNKVPRGQAPKWNVTKASRVCSGVYKAYRVNKSLGGTGYTNAPPDGYVCYRGNRSDLK